MTQQYREGLLHILSESTARVTGQDYFEHLLLNVTKALSVKNAILTKCVNTKKTRLRTLAYVKGERLADNFEYTTEGTPCKIVMEERKNLFVASEVEKTYVREVGVETYAGIPIISSTDEVIGHIAVFDSQKFDFTQQQSEVLTIFASRSAAEIERITAAENLKEAYDKISLLEKKLAAENEYLKEEYVSNHNFKEIITKSKVLIRTLNNADKAAQTDSIILITGETGTGKELVARAVHRNSKRSQQSIIKVNCAALPANLIESELFGYEKGAFTGANRQKMGRFDLAHKGTLFLDEIGEMPLELQPKLLRAIQEGEIERLGSTTTQKVDVRIIAATNRDLAEEVKKGNFREDLYYRLNVFPINLIPIRERKEDIIILAKHLLEKNCRKENRPIPKLSKFIEKILLAYDWPGNVRELENVLERALILTAGNYLNLQDAFRPDIVSSDKEEFVTLEDIERNHIIHVLQKTHWKISGNRGAADILGINPNTLHSRIKKLGIEKE